MSLAGNSKAGANMWAAACLALLLGLGGCQSTNPEEALGVEREQPESAQAADGKEVLGSGEVGIAMLVPRSSARGRDFRDGAALAVRDLGTQSITLTIHDTGGDPARASAAAAEAVAGGAKLIVGAAEGGELAGVLALGSRPPVILLSGARQGTDVFALASDEAESAIEMASFAVATGKRKIALIAPPALGAASRQKLAEAIARDGGEFLGAVDISGQELSAEGQTRLAAAEAVIIFGGDLPQQGVAALRAAHASPDGVSILGTTGWTREHHTSTALAGAYVPAFDQNGLKEVGERMQAAHGRPISTDAALAFDAVALAAGIVRAAGAQGLTGEPLRQPTGFRGSTGAFRFERDGAVRRLFAVYQLSARGLRPVAPAPEGF